MYRYLHRKGICRTLNSGSRGFMGSRGTMYVETRGPRLLGEILWQYALRHLDWPRPNWDTVTITKTEKLSAFRYRWLIEFDRIAT